MTSSRALLIGLYLVLALLIAIVGLDDGMARCQLSHSFDVCHDTLY